MFATERDPQNVCFPGVGARGSYRLPPGAPPAEQEGRMAVDNCGPSALSDPKAGSILNADGGKLVTINIGKMEFATFRKMELQLLGKMICKKHSLFWYIENYLIYTKAEIEFISNFD